MAKIRLHNEDWGYETNCFVCEPANQTGLRIPFFHDDEAHTVTAQFTLTESFSGAPGFAHGGVSLAILDEAMAWACIAVAHQWAVTTETATTFARPVLVGQEFVVTARIDSETDATIATSAEITNAEGKSCASATATFTKLGEAQAQRIVGDDQAIDTTYTRSGDA